MKQTLILCFLLLVVSISVTTTHAFALTPLTTPEQIIHSQLVALQQDDILGVYEFSSPLNKQQTVNVERFGQMVRGGPYRFLIGHQKADILLSSNMADSKQYLVRVIPKEFPAKGTIVEFWWSLSRCKTGPHLGCYMVDAVIPNA
jgi:hypothetical protein